MRNSHLSAARSISGRCTVGKLKYLLIRTLVMMQSSLEIATSGTCFGAGQEALKCHKNWAKHWVWSLLQCDMCIVWNYAIALVSVWFMPEQLVKRLDAWTPPGRTSRSIWTAVSKINATAAEICIMECEVWPLVINARTYDPWMLQLYLMFGNIKIYIYISIVYVIVTSWYGLLSSL